MPRAAPLDRQTSRQLDKGKLEVEARLDLHGMRQRDAHAQLRRFLKTAQAKGLKHVLVITGKGVDQTAAKSFYEEDERGVLRQAVPHWLADPEFATLVVSFSQAPRRLGGEGALYVRLRRPRSVDFGPHPSRRAFGAPQDEASFHGEERNRSPARTMKK